MSRVVFVAVAAAAVWFHLWEPLRQVSIIGVGATLVGGYPIFKEAIENARASHDDGTIHDDRDSGGVINRPTFYRTR